SDLLFTHLTSLLFHTSTFFYFFFFNDTATPEIYTLSLHDALPIFAYSSYGDRDDQAIGNNENNAITFQTGASEEDPPSRAAHLRSEEHTSELQSRGHLVCRLLLEKKKNKDIDVYSVSKIHTWQRMM